MAEAQLPRQINMLRAAEQGLQFAGDLLLSKMPRLNSLLADETGQVNLSLQFGKDEQRLPFVKGHLESEVTLTCQRCMQLMQCRLENDFNLGLVLSDAQAKALPSYYEPVMVDEDAQDLLPMIEDELILCLPIVALHDTDECHAPVTTSIEQDVEIDNPLRRELSKLK